MHCFFTASVALHKLKTSLRQGLLSHLEAFLVWLGQLSGLSQGRFSKSITQQFVFYVMSYSSHMTFETHIINPKSAIDCPLDSH